MAKKKQKKKKKMPEQVQRPKDFLDMIAPSIVKFETGYYICGNTFRCIWALREYPTSTDDLAILRHLGEKHGVTLHIYTRMVSPLEERKIVHNAEIRNRMKDMTVVVTAKGGGAGRALVDEHGAEHRLLRFQRLWRLPGKQFLIHTVHILPGASEYQGLLSPP